MKHLKIYEYFEEESQGKNNNLTDDQDFDVDVEFHEFINDWETEHRIPMTKSDLEDVLAKQDVEDFLAQGGDMKELLNKTDREGKLLSVLINSIKTKHDWYNDELFELILDKIWDMIQDFEEPDSVEWSQDDDEYMALAGDDEDEDDIENLRQKSYARYAQEDDSEEREDEIYGKVKAGMKSGQRYEPSQAQKDFLQKKADKFLKRYEMQNIVGFNKFLK